MQRHRFIQVSNILTVSMLFMPALIAGGVAQENSKPSAMVVELIFEARDTIPLSVSYQTNSTARTAAWFENGKAVIHPMIAQDLRRTDAGKGNLFPHQVFALKDTKILIIVTRKFLGHYRTGTRATMSLRRALPRFPERSQAKRLVITPFGTKPSLWNLIPWPNLDWSFSKNALSKPGDDSSKPELVLTIPAGKIRLKPGQSYEFPKQVMTLPVVMMQLKPVKIGETGPMETQTIDLKSSDFTVETTLRFHGHLPLEVGK